MADSDTPLVIHRDSGDGDPVLLIHGFPDTAATWDGIADELNKAGYRTIVPHLRGYHPDSIRPGRGYDARSLGEDVPALLDHLGLDQAVVVGHDWGAAVSYAAASLAPERVRAIATIAIPHPRTLRPTLLLAFKARHFATLKFPWAAAQFRLFDLSGVDILYKRWAPSWRGPERDACVAAVKQAFRDPKVLDAALDYYRALSPKGDPATRNKLGMPALVVGGTEDLLPPQAFHDSTRAYTGPVRVEILEGTGHWPHREQQAQFTGLLLAFLRELS